MPNRAPTQCRHYGCGRLVPAPGYCAEHEADAIGWKDDRIRGTRHQRGYGSRWEKLRLRILARDNGLCQPCLRDDRITAARYVDHVVSKSEGGGDEDSNLQSICKACHDAKTATESAKSRSGRAPGAI